MLQFQIQPQFILWLTHIPPSFFTLSPIYWHSKPSYFRQTHSYLLVQVCLLSEPTLWTFTFPLLPTIILWLSQTLLTVLPWLLWSTHFSSTNPSVVVAMTSQCFLSNFALLQSSLPPPQYSTLFFSEVGCHVNAIDAAAHLKTYLVPPPPWSVCSRNTVSAKHVPDVWWAIFEAFIQFFYSSSPQKRAITQVPW